MKIKNLITALVVCLPTLAMALQSSKKSHTNKNQTSAKPGYFANGTSFLGEYSRRSGIRFFGYTKEECESEAGQFDDESCYHSAENKVFINTNEQNEVTVEISVIYGPANMRDFSGIVTRVKKNSLTVKEADIENSGSVNQLTEDGCEMKIEIVKNKAVLKLEDSCDPDLGRASESIKP